MISLTGSTGFVGKNLTTYFNNYKISVENITRQSLSEQKFSISDQVDTIVHLAGKAHDLKNTSNKDEYYEVNTELTKKIFDLFLKSNASVFITLSSVKAVADVLDVPLTEHYIPNPKTHYGKSKLFAEEYILSKQIPVGKRVYILRPCMIHGPGNKGNLNLLYKMVSKGLPWPLGSFNNKRSFCSIDNLCFIINELIENENVPSGVYNISDDEPLSTNTIIELICNSLNKKSKIWSLPKFLIKRIAYLGDILKLPLNSERLNKLTESYIVNNSKIKIAINKPLPLSSRDGMVKTFGSF
jgi:nucleoside-diphosphate-sugar epimerase